MPRSGDERDDARMGKRIQGFRKARGWTQHGLAQRAHISYSTITKIETGAMPVSPTVQAACARALRVHITDITGQPYVDNLRGDQLDELVQPVRLAVANPFHVTATGIPPRPVREIRSDIDRLDALRVHGRGAEIGPHIPALIDELLHAVSMLPPGRDQELAYRLLASSYRLAYIFAHRLGYPEVGLMALERQDFAAARSGDPYLKGVITHCRSNFFLYHGAFDIGLAGIDAMTREVDTAAGAADPHAMSMLGSLHLKAAVLHSRRRVPGAAQTAEDHVREAAVLAARLPADFDPYGLVFDTTNVRLHRVSVRLDLGKVGEAIEDGEKVVFPEGWARHRVAHHHMDLARGYERVRRPDKALRSLVSARQAEPVQTRYHPTTHETVLALLSGRGKPSEELRRYARWVGV
ncbi:helix-turn-helix domain-containing protein [Streptomyces marincola]|uniref:helix-turn-helix domain-containing protein n=1 Tax=Streptomyces marincola TaxID=2878388 RepID=UPI001CF121CA|nr:helix-turn-helix transcriptional regulator [Streptomyces marincola]UCM87909.1 helix-turn-helix domain-containing protein [Streptomyces marincola]